MSDPMNNPMDYDWFQSQQKADGTIHVYAGQGEQSLRDFEKYQDRTHGHFIISPDGELGMSRPGPNPNS